MQEYPLINKLLMGISSREIRSVRSNVLGGGVKYTLLEPALDYIPSYAIYSVVIDDSGITVAGRG